MDPTRPAMPLREGHPHEEAVLFGTRSNLTGIVTHAASSSGTERAADVLLLDAGATHRVGPNRLYVHLARRLAARGHRVLRFDLSGVGDSPPRGDSVPYAESILLETGEALDFLARRYGSERFLLSGLCSGAATAFVTARRDPRVAGALMINAIGHLHADHPEASDRIYRRALTRHAWRIALFSSFRAKNWRKLLSGRLTTRRMLSMMLGAPVSVLTSPRGRSAREPGPSPLADIEELLARGVLLLHVYAEGDEGLDYFHVLLGRHARSFSPTSRLGLHVMKGANHLFTQLWAQEAVLDLAEDWFAQARAVSAAAPRRPPDPRVARKRRRSRPERTDTTGRADA